MPQQPLELIVARQLAEHLALPMALADAVGNLVFYNDAAASLLGGPFDRVGVQRLEDAAGLFSVCAVDGGQVPAESTPLAVAIREWRPINEGVRFRSLDGEWHDVDVIALPLSGIVARHAGVLAIFTDMDG